MSEDAIDDLEKEYEQVGENEEEEDGDVDSPTINRY